MQLNHTIFSDISTDICFCCHFHQTNEHPNPGKKFSARGFPRHCYLPDNEKGRKVRAHCSELGRAAARGVETFSIVLRLCRSSSS